MVRYYGLYARNKVSKAKDLLVEILKRLNQKGWRKEAQRQIKEMFFSSSYRERMISSFNKDPCLCPNCNTEMIVEKIVGENGRIIYDLWDERFQKETRKQDAKVSQKIKESIRGHQLPLSTVWV